MSKYENSVFPYSVHATVKLPAWRPKDTNVTLGAFVHLFTPRLVTFSRQLLPIEKFFFKITWKIHSF